MVKRKRVILFLVEGPSDEAAIVEPMQAVFTESFNESLAVRSEAFHCDVTTVRLFSSNTLISVCSKARETVRRFIINRIETRHEYEWKDLDKIVHIVDLDGAFVTKKYIKEGNCEGFLYDENSITASSISDAERRNAEKSSALRELMNVHELTYARRSVPYHLYFMSRNLEHALYGLSQACPSDKKELLSAAFAQKYCNDPEGFLELLRSKDVRVPGKTLRDTWNYVQQNGNSLLRGSNLFLLFEESGDMPLSSPTYIDHIEAQTSGKSPLAT